MAYVNIAMLKMGILREYHDEKTFYQALVNQYPDISFKALRSYRDARQKLMDAAGVRFIYEIGSDATEVEYVRNMIEQAISSEKHNWTIDIRTKIKPSSLPSDCPFCYGK